MNRVCERLGDLLDRRFVWLMSAMALFIGWANYYAKSGVGMLPGYLAYKQILLNVLARRGLPSDLPTYPMWGYGIFLLPTENRAVIYAIQNALAIAATIFVLQFIEWRDLLSATGMRFLKLLVILSVPLYVFNSMMWPYSIAISLQQFSLVMFVCAIMDERFAWAGISGILFGLALNFRSDYVLMPVGLAFIGWAWKGFRARTGGMIVMWMALIYAMLVPWGLYTRHATGKFLMTSTNGGAVFFCGLGQRPDNKWGIILSDSDPVMHRLLIKELGSDSSFTSPAANELLKNKFLEYVKADPAEYTRKCLYATALFFTEGVVRGEYYESPACGAGCERDFQDKRALFLSHPFSFAIASPGYVWIVLLHVWSAITGRLFTFLALLTLPVAFILALKNRALYFIVVAAVIAYQAAINILACHKAASTSMIYMFLLMTLTYVVDQTGFKRLREETLR